MSLMNVKKPHGTVYGHATAAYEQDGLLYDAQYRSLNSYPELKPKPAPKPTLTGLVMPDPLENSKAFLRQILKENPLSKSVVYKESEASNQVWDNVRDAAIEMAIVKFTQNKLEMWRLPEEA